MATYSKGEAGARNRLISTLVNQPTGPFGPPGGIDNLPGTSPVTLPPWPIDPATGQPTLGPIPPMGPPIVPVDPIPGAPQPPTGPYHLPAGSQPGSTTQGLGAMANDYAAWVSDPANAGIVAQFAGNPRGLQAYWLNAISAPQMATPTARPYYPSRGSGNHDPLHPGQSIAPTVGPVNNSNQFNPFYRYNTGTNTLPQVGPPKPTTPTPPNPYIITGPNGKPIDFSSTWGFGGHTPVGTVPKPVQPVHPPDWTDRSIIHPPVSTPPNPTYTSTGRYGQPPAGGIDYGHYGLNTRSGRRTNRQNRLHQLTNFLMGV